MLEQKLIENTFTHKFKRLLIVFFAFSYGLLTVQLSSADDIDIYTRAVSYGKGGAPVLTFVLDNSGSMAWEMEDNSGAEHVFEERMFLLHNAMHDQFTSMKGTFKVGLFNFGSQTGILQKEAKPLASIENSSLEGVSTGGTFDYRVVKDVAWAPGEAAKEGQRNISFPVLQSEGGQEELGDQVQGRWTNSDGRNSSVADASFNLTGTVDGNKAIYYQSNSNSRQRFYLDRVDQSSNPPDPYLYLLDEDGNVIAQNNDRDTGSEGCPAGWTLRGPWHSRYCERWERVQVYSCRWWGRCGWRWEWQRQTMNTISVGGDIDSYIREDMNDGEVYTLIIATNGSGQAGDFILRIDDEDDGYFFNKTPGETSAQNAAFRFNGVSIPKGASIASATLITELDDTADTQSLTVRADKSMAPLPLVGDVENGRDWFTQPSKIISGGDERDDVRIDVTSLVRDKLNQPEWCQESDLVFMIEGKEPLFDIINLFGINTNVLRDEPFLIEASEQGDSTPLLEIKWSHNGAASCYSKTINAKPGAIGDDVEQNASDSIEFDNEVIDMGAGHKAGLRFGFIKLPNALDGNGNAIGLDIPNAYLTFQAANTSNPGTIYISAIHEEGSGLAQPFFNETKALDGKNLGATIEWVPDSWEQGEVYTSPNLASIILPLLEDENWEYQGTIGFVVYASSNQSTQFYAWEKVDGGKESVERSGNSVDWNQFGQYATQLTIQANSNQPFENGDAYRKELWDVMLTEAYEPRTSTPLKGAYVEAAEYMLGDGYDSPLDEVGQCQVNTLVLLSDGDPTSDTNNEGDFEKIINRGQSNTQSCHINNNDDWDCPWELSTALKEGRDWYDGGDADEAIRAIKTYSIAYGPITKASDGTESETARNMRILAQNGDGTFYAADDSSKLTEAIQEIVGSVNDAGASISVPGVAVSAFNRITVLDEVYYSLFKPSVRRNWAGNAKRYRLQDKAIRDVYGNEAINLDSTYFENEAQSWWSSAVDGSVVSVGGAAGEIDPTDRKVFTYLGNNGSSLGTTTGPMSGRGLALSSGGLNISTNGDQLGANDIGMQFLQDIGPGQAGARKTKIVEWLQGGTAGNPRREMGAPLHSSPVMVNYQENAGELISTVYVSTNEGYLHAIDTGEPSSNSSATNIANRGGKELFSFIPKETLVNAALLEQNAVVDFKDEDYQHTYGLDSSWTYWREAGDDPAIGSDDHVYIYGGMRRGGRMLYGLNVSDVYHGGDQEPRLLFAVGVSNIEATATPVTGSPAGNVSTYADIGQTWSIPRVRKTIWNNEVKTVLLMGGGYDPQHDDPSHEGNDDMGNQVYMLDAENGELLWAMETKSAIAARVSPFDRTGDDFFDSFYAVDLQGRVLRFDMNSSRSDFTQHEIADLGGSGVDNRKFYAEPSIANFRNAKTGKIDMMIAVGSGYRANPTNKSVQERFHLIFDRGAHTANPSAPDEVLTSDMLVDLKINDDTKTGLSYDPSDPNGIYQVPGWSIDFDKNNGEKSIGTPLIFNGIVLFTAYTHETSDSTTCTPVIGQTRLYVMDIAGKGNADIFGGEGAFLEDVTPGMSSGVQLITVGNTDGTPDSPALLVDKKLVEIPGDPDSNDYKERLCRLVSCEGRDLDRSSWYSDTMSADEGAFEP